jgi:hypothetical protein
MILLVREFGSSNEPHARANPSSAILAPTARVAAPTATAKHRSLPAVPGRVFVGENITPEYLASFFKDHTAIQASQLAKPFIGKWIELSGPLGDVVCLDPKYGAQVTLQQSDDDWNGYRYMYFDPPWLEHLAMLRRGDPLTIIGEIKSIDGALVTMHHCELIP